MDRATTGPGPLLLGYRERLCRAGFGPYKASTPIDAVELSYQTLLYSPLALFVLGLMALAKSATVGATRNSASSITCHRCTAGLNVPSSGFVAIIMLLPLCERVTVYGFGVEMMQGKIDGKDSFGYHYYK
eukprot:scaffold53132_cov44-Prasinocladus_malaysianus.AAC.1